MARYNINATVINSSKTKDIQFNYVCKGTDDDPTGGEHGKLYHGEMTQTPTPTRVHANGGVSTFAAKSTGSTIQGTMVFSVVGGGDDVWMYFHVPSFGDRHKESSYVSMDYKNGGHPTVTYTVTLD